MGLESFDGEIRQLLLAISGVKVGPKQASRRQAIYHGVCF